MDHVLHEEHLGAEATVPSLHSHLTPIQHLHQALSYFHGLESTDRCCAKCGRPELGKDRMFAMALNHLKVGVNAVLLGQRG